MRYNQPPPFANWKTRRCLRIFGTAACCCAHARFGVLRNVFLQSRITPSHGARQHLRCRARELDGRRDGHHDSRYSGPRVGTGARRAARRRSLAGHDHGRTVDRTKTWRIFQPTTCLRPATGSTITASFIQCADNAGDVCQFREASLTGSARRISRASRRGAAGLGAHRIRRLASSAGGLPGDAEPHPLVRHLLTSLKSDWKRQSRAADTVVQTRFSKCRDNSQIGSSRIILATVLLLGRTLPSPAMEARWFPGVTRLC